MPTGLDLVRAFVSSAATDIHPPPSTPSWPTVALSRGAGSNGEEIGRLLAHELNVRYLDRELLEAIAREVHGDKNALARVDERVRNIADQFLYNFFTQQNADDEVYQVHLIHTLLEIVEHGGGVLVGRGAHLVVPRDKAFRVHICGSLEVCADRLQRQEGLSHAAARKKVEQENRQRAKFIQSRFGHDPADISVFDLIVNTDRFDTTKAARTILFAMHETGFEVPSETLGRLSLSKPMEMHA